MNEKHEFFVSVFMNLGVGSIENLQHEWTMAKLNQLLFAWSRYLVARMYYQIYLSQIKLFQ